MLYTKSSILSLIYGSALQVQSTFSKKCFAFNTSTNQKLSLLKANSLFSQVTIHLKSIIQNINRNCKKFNTVIIKFLVKPSKRIIYFLFTYPCFPKYNKSFLSWLSINWQIKKWIERSHSPIERNILINGVFFSYSFTQKNCLF